MDNKKTDSNNLKELWDKFLILGERRLKQLLDEGNRMEETDCPACSGKNYSYFLSNRGINYHKCRDCGAYFVSPRFKEELIMSDFFDPEMELFKEILLTSLEKGQSEMYIRRMDMISSLSGGAKGGLLDIGCACGGFLKYAKEKRWSVFGQEICEVFIPEAQKRGIEIFRGFDDIPWDKIDCVTMWSVLEHIYWPKEFFKDLSARMKPGALLGIWVPNPASIGAGLLGSEWPLFGPLHVFMTPPAALRTMLESAGFLIRDTKTYFQWDHIGNALKKRGQDIERPVLTGMPLLRAVTDAFEAGDMIELYAQKE